METQEQFDLVVEPLAKFFKTLTKAEIQEEAVKRSIQLQPVLTAEETLASEQLMAREFWMNVEHDELNDTITYPGPFAKFTETPLNSWHRAPLIGEHNNEIYSKELGFSKEDIETLKGGGII